MAEVSPCISNSGQNISQNHNFDGYFEDLTRLNALLIFRLTSLSIFAAHTKKSNEESLFRNYHACIGRVNSKLFECCNRWIISRQIWISAWSGKENNRKPVG